MAPAGKLRHSGQTGIESLLGQLRKSRFTSKFTDRKGVGQLLQEHKSVRRLALWLEYQLRYYDFPVFAAKVALELRLGLLFVPCNDG